MRKMDLSYGVRGRVFKVVCVCAICMHGPARVAKAQTGEEIPSVIFNLFT